jgi:hypothetical protein
MKKIKLSREWWYAILTIFLPLTIFILFLVLDNRAHAYRWDAMWLALYQFSNYILYLLIPVAINLALGPSFLAFWGYKRSRVIILILNLIVVGLILANLPWLCLIGTWALLWGWALSEKPRERSEHLSKYGIYWLLAAHICAIAAVNYKSPERIVAEEALNHLTIKWNHDSKSEYFMLYSNQNPFETTQLAVWP